MMVQKNKEKEIVVTFTDEEIKEIMRRAKRLEERAIRASERLIVLFDLDKE